MVGYIVGRMWGLFGLSSRSPAHARPPSPFLLPPHAQVTCDDFFSGQAAGLAGGTTMHIDFALPVGHSLLAGWEEWQRKAGRAVADYGLHMAVTSWSAEVAEDMGTLTQRGINSFKFFMAYKGGCCLLSPTDCVRWICLCNAEAIRPTL